MRPSEARKTTASPSGGAGRCLLLAVSAVLVVLSPAAAPRAEGAGDRQVVLELAARAEVSGSQIRLGDVARPAGGGADHWKRLAEVVLGAAPLPGASRELSTEYIELRLRQAGFSPEAFRWTGARAVEVVAPGVAVEAGPVRQAIEAYLARAGAPAPLRVALVGWEAEVRVPPGPLEVRVAFGPPVLRAGTAVFAMDLEAAGTVRRVWVRAVLESPVGQAAGADLEAGASGARTAQEAVQEPQGRPGGSSPQAGPAAVRRGTPLLLMAVRGAVRVSAPAVALRDGQVGEVVPVLNAASGTPVWALLTGPNEAEALRTDRP